jgi:hypothetical protein
MITIDLEAYVVQSARLLDIPLAAGSAPLVARQLQVLLAHANSFAEFDLEPETSPLPGYVP